MSGPLIVHPTQITFDIPTYDGEIVIQVCEPWARARPLLPDGYLDVGSLPRPESSSSRRVSLGAGTFLHPVLRMYNFAQPEGIEGQQGNEPVPDGGVRAPSLCNYNLLTTCRPLMVLDNILLSARAGRTLM